MKTILHNISLFLRDQNGTSAIEYAFIASLICVVIVAAVGTVGVGVGEDFAQVEQAFINAQ